MGARRPLAHRPQQAVPRDGDQEDRRANPASRGYLRASVREDSHPAALSGARHGGAADTRPSLQGKSTKCITLTLGDERMNKTREDISPSRLYCTWSERAVC